MRSCTCFVPDCQAKNHACTDRDPVMDLHSRGGMRRSGRDWIWGGELPSFTLRAPRRDFRVARLNPGMRPMITPRHEKIEFFKYYTAEAAKLTLEHCSRKWSTPLCFNDPFDNQFDLHFEDPSEQLAQRLVDQFHQIIDSPAPLRPNQFGHLTPIVEMIRQVRRANPGFQYTKEELTYLGKAKSSR